MHTPNFIAESTKTISVASTSSIFSFHLEPRAKHTILDMSGPWRLHCSLSAFSQRCSASRTPLSASPQTSCRRLYFIPSQHLPWVSQLHGINDGYVPLVQPQSSNTQRVTTFARARRRFSSSPIQRHGHLTPPKPGEEYVANRTIAAANDHTDNTS